MPPSPVLLSPRLRWDQGCNLLASEMADRQARGLATIDLTGGTATAGPATLTITSL